MQNRPYLSIVIPAYNQAERLGATLREVAAWVAAEGMLAEVLVVDAGSSDGTAAAVEALAHELPIVRLAASTPHRGKGHALRLGMRHARGTLRLYMDGAASIHELPALLARIADGADIVIGARRGRHGGWSRFASRLLAVDGVEDAACGFKLFTAQAAKRMFERAASQGWGIDLEVLVRARKRGYRIDEVEVEWRDAARVRPRLGSLSDALRAGADVARVRQAAQASGSFPRV